jgi:hypothetical protein
MQRDDNEENKIIRQVNYFKQQASALNYKARLSSR